MSDDILLQAKAREAIQQGVLPRSSPDSVRGGPATGASCDICGTATIAGEFELEFEFTHSSKSGRTRYHAHPRCFSIFSREALGRAIYPSTQQFAESRNSTAPGDDAS